MPGKEQISGALIWSNSEQDERWKGEVKVVAGAHKDSPGRRLWPNRAKQR